MVLTTSDFMRLRVEFIKDYPDAPFVLGVILGCYEREGKTYLNDRAKLEPALFPFNFRKLRWHDHRTLEQLLSIEYMKVVSGSNYYGVGDIVEVTEMYYNNKVIVGGKDSVLFNPKGHYFNITQLQPSNKEEHDKFWAK